MDPPVPICFRLDPYCDERASLLVLSKYIAPGDILICDRNYYGSDFFRFLDAKNIKLLCRLSRSNKTIIGFEGESDINYEYDGVSARRIIWEHTAKQTFGDTDGKMEQYYYATNLDRVNFPFKKIIELYHSRWDIEEFFKSLKHQLGGAFYNHKSLETIHRKLYSQMITSIYAGIVMGTCKELRIGNKPAHNRKWRQKESFAHTLEFLDDILNCIIYKPTNWGQEIDRLLKIAVRKAVTAIRPDRKYPRKSIVSVRFYGEKAKKKERSKTTKRKKRKKRRMQT